jgi:hypothetical protein
MAPQILFSLFFGCRSVVLKGLPGMLVFFFQRVVVLLVFRNALVKGAHLHLKCAAGGNLFVELGACLVMNLGLMRPGGFSLASRAVKSAAVLRTVSSSVRSRPVAESASDRAEFTWTSASACS